MVPYLLRLVLRRLVWVTAAGEGWRRIITAVLIARRSYAARNSWIRLLMPEGAGPSRSSRRLDQSRAAIRARSGLAPGSPAPGSCRGGRPGTLIGNRRIAAQPVRAAVVTRMYQPGRPAPLPGIRVNGGVVKVASGSEPVTCGQ